MMETGKNGEDKLSRLLREMNVQSPEEKPSLHFTENVLKGIEAELESQAVTELALKSLLQQHAVEQPSADFQHNILAKLAPAPAIKFKPVISARMWYLIAAGVAALLLACYLLPSGKPMETPRFITYASRASGYLFKVQPISRDTFEILFMTIVGLASLMLIDFFLRQKRLTYNKLARS
ncbi:hypothetical protein [Dyadobacter luticola]|uniref:Uncharacterized protein n=1 Tax=Dyadobacter luticola TaxID=1979387 RepID=A0A5R9KXW6_9BACT|nr:hypothetical protein [Dyadobacter luticola]TLV01011.1 hypothetical protein FEN17_16235 [Dyadobacter luticola]